MGINEADHGLGEIIKALNAAPYNEAAGSLVHLSLQGVKGLIDGIGSGIEIANGLKDGASKLDEVARTTGAAAIELTEVDGHLPELVGSAIDSLETMKSTSASIGEGAEQIDANLRQAMEHLTAFQACIDNHEGLVGEVLGAMLVGHASAASAAEQLTLYRGLLNQ